MSTVVSVINRIIIAVCVKVQTVYRLRIKITRIIRRNKSAPFGAVVTRIKIVELCILVVIVTTISDGITSCNTVCIKGDRTITPSIVGIAADLRSVNVVNGYDVVSSLFFV